MRRSAAPSRNAGKQTEKMPRIEINASPQSSQPLVTASGPGEPSATSISDLSSVLYYEAVYAKMSTKKHKKWEGDGFVVISGRAVKLISETGKTLSTGSGHKLSFLSSLEEGSLIKVGGFEAELLSRISSSAYRSKVTGAIDPESMDAPSLENPGVSSKHEDAFPTSIEVSVSIKHSLPIRPNVPGSDVLHSGTCDDDRRGVMRSLFKTVVPSPGDNTLGGLVMRPPPGRCVWVQNPDGLPLTDVILSPLLSKRLRPHQREGVQFLYECLMGFNTPETTESTSAEPVYGCILADEMGLGKTVQAIATLWLLHTQGPYGGRPVVNKCLVVTPSSLIDNWAKEITKWVGRERLPFYCVTQNSPVKAYLNQGSRAAPVLIMSYEMFLQHAAAISEIPNLDMVICDEGHRLKNAGIHTSLALRNLPANRRLLLTGTPVQNHLDELWSLSEFCAPGRLAPNQDAFRRQFVLKRSSSRTRGEPEAVSDSDEGVSNEEEPTSCRLSRLLSTFLLRRTVDVIQTELPTKSDYVLFCRPSSLQTQLETIMREWVQRELNMYPPSGSDLLSENEENDMESPDDGDFEDRENLEPGHLGRTPSGVGSQSVLCAITAFRKMYNHPALLYRFIKPAQCVNSTRMHPALTEKLMAAFSQREYSADGRVWFEQNCNPISRSNLISIVQDSGKLLALVHMLQRLFSRDNLQLKHKLVLVSNFTQTLDVLESVCRSLTGSTPLRLDGQTAQKRRLDVVQEFNDRKSAAQILLLSSRAGGTGLNLVGADHLILFDMDWNPANDAQAMARIWRPGQSRPVHLYRLVTCGGLEERMFQRQAAKLALSHQTLDVPWDEGSLGSDNVHSTKRGGVLTREELRDLFQSSEPDWLCWTHELIGCTCQTNTSSPSLSTDSSDSLSVEKLVQADEQSTRDAEEEEEDEDGDSRACQLGPVSRKPTPRSHSSTGIPTSESLAYLLHWKHSLSVDAIRELNDPLLSPVDNVEWPVCAVFSRITDQC